MSTLSLYSRCRWSARFASEFGAHTHPPLVPLIRSSGHRMKHRGALASIPQTQLCQLLRPVWRYPSLSCRPLIKPPLEVRELSLLALLSLSCDPNRIPPSGPVGNSVLINARHTECATTELSIHSHSIHEYKVNPRTRPVGGAWERLCFRPGKTVQYLPALSSD